MNIHRKYEKTYRIDMKNLFVKGKFMLKNKDENLLIGGNVTITEKMDGGNVQIYKNKKGQVWLGKKSSTIDNSHPQYKFFENWAYENEKQLKALPNNIVIYMELLACVHTIYYNNLPDMCLVFDIYDLNEKKYLKWIEVVKICDSCGLYTVPLIYTGKTNKELLENLIPKESKYGDLAEGIVVKNYRQQIRGKIVKKQFKKELEEINKTAKHWQFRKIKLNKILKIPKKNI